MPFIDDQQIILCPQVMDTQESQQSSQICAKLANIRSLQGSIELAWPLLWVKGIPHLSS
jgi:hypothetical protein